MLTKELTRIFVLLQCHCQQCWLLERQFPTEILLSLSFSNEFVTIHRTVRCIENLFNFFSNNHWVYSTVFKNSEVDRNSFSLFLARFAKIFALCSTIWLFLRRQLRFLDKLMIYILRDLSKVIWWLKWIKLILVINILCRQESRLKRNKIINMIRKT